MIFPQSSSRGAALGAVSLAALLAHAAGPAEAQQGELPPVVVQQPRTTPKTRRVEAQAPRSAAAPSRASRPARRGAPGLSSRSAASAPPSPTPAAAAAPVPAPGERGYTASPTGLNLGTPSRTGSRLGLTPFQTPAAVEIIPGQKIQERGQNTIQEAITQNATGITNIGSPGNGFQAYTSRGFSGVGSIMTLYDGTRTYIGSGTLTFPFDTWNVDRIEVLRGPASVLYGEGSIGGAINIVPKKPTFVSVNEMRAAYGSDGTKRLALDSGGAISQDVAYRLNISGNQADGWLKPNGGFRNLAVSGALLWQVNPDFSLTLSHDYGYNEPLAYFGSPLVNGRVPRNLRKTNFNVSDNIVAFSDNITQLKAEWSITPDITLRNTAYRLTSDRHWRDTETYAYQPLTGLLRRSDYIEIYHTQEQIGNRFDATWKSDVFDMKNTFLIGFDVNHIDFKNTSNSPYLGTSYVNPYFFDPGTFIHASPTLPSLMTTTNQASVFAENRIELTDQFAIIGGLRYEAPQMRRRDPRNPANSFETDFEALTWRAGAVYNPLPETALFVQYATGVDPIGNLISLSMAQKDLRLTTGQQVEGGVKQKLFGDFLEFTLAGYHIQKDNLQTVLPDNPTLSVQVGQQSSTGFEAFASMKLLETLRLEGNLALLKAQYDDFSQTVAGRVVSYRGNRPVDVPNEVANLWVSWAFWPRWEARVGVQYVGATFSDAANTLKRPAYTILNASLDYRVTDNSKLSIRGYNLTDEVYAVRGSSNTWVLGRPRSVEVACAITF